MVLVKLNLIKGCGHGVTCNTEKFAGQCNYSVFSHCEIKKLSHLA